MFTSARPLHCGVLFKFIIPRSFGKSGLDAPSSGAEFSMTTLSMPNLNSLTSRDENVCVHPMDVLRTLSGIWVPEYGRGVIFLRFESPQEKRPNTLSFSEPTQSNRTSNFESF